MTAAPRPAPHIIHAPPVLAWFLRTFGYGGITLPPLGIFILAERPEWGCVGLMGKLRIRKGQPVDARWIKMRDVSETVEEWLVR